MDDTSGHVVDCDGILKTFACVNFGSVGICDQATS